MIPMCCGQLMRRGRKRSLLTGKYIFYYCELCGKKNIIVRTKVRRWD